jgi:type I restriction enzyme S subunit
MTRTVLLGDICDVRDGTHDSPKPKDSGHPLVTSKHIKSGKIDVSSANLISNEDYLAVNKRSKVDKWDILMGMIGTVGELAFIDYEPQFAIKNIGLIKTGNKLKGQYLYYYLQSNKAKNHIQSVLAGSTQKFISLGQLRKFPIELPEESTQRQIVDFLSAIDEKIELNRKMNETLEKMGQALFKKYFITNPATKNWKPGNIGDFARVKSGFAFKGSSFAESGDHPVIKIKNISNLGVDLENVTYISNDVLNDRMDEYVAVSGDILIAMSGNTTGKIGLMPRTNKKYYLNQRVGKYYLKSPLYSGFLYFFLKSKINQDYIIQSAYGSAQPNIGPNQLEGQRILIPDNKMLDSVGLLFQSIVNKIALNLSEDKDLITLRDSLLSRLISGRIKV